MTILERVTSPDNLQAALETVVRKAGAPGPDGVTTAQFAEQSSTALPSMGQQLLAGTYHPMAARVVKIPKPGGGVRALAIGCVRDRVAQGAIARVLSEVLEPEMSRAAYAYRAGRGTRQALSAVERFIVREHLWATRTDIETFFDSIPTDALCMRLLRATDDPDLVLLVRRFLGAGALDGGSIVDPVSGTPQGSPLSPLLSNLYLASFDEAILAQGYDLVRYGDDMCVMSGTRDEALAALDLVKSGVRRLGLRLNEQKTEVRHLGHGFTFLGYQFDLQGRKPSAKAARGLHKKVSKLLAKRDDGYEEVLEQVLRGWVVYYGSFSRVNLPPDAARIAERIGSKVAEQTQFGTGNEEVNRGLTMSPEQLRTDDDEQDDTPAWREPWESWASRLSSSSEHEAVRAEIGIADDAAWRGLRDALIQRDSGAAAELLAQLGRFGDAEMVLGAGPAQERPSERPEADTEQENEDDQPQLDLHRGDSALLLSLFGGVDHLYLRDRMLGDAVHRERVAAPLTEEALKQHFDGDAWIGVFPVRRNNTVQFACFRCIISAKARHARPAEEGHDIILEVRRHTRRIIDVLLSLGLKLVISLEPRKGYWIWLPFDSPQGAARAKALLSHVERIIGDPGPKVTREQVPIQTVVKRNKPGTPAMLPLGVDPRTKQRAWLYDEKLQPVLKPLAHLRRLERNSGAQVAQLLGVGRTMRVPPKQAPSPSPAHPAERPRPGPTTPATDLERSTSPFLDFPRAQKVYLACAVFRDMVNQVLSGGGLENGERHFVADTLGRLGDESEPALRAVFRHLDDYRAGLVHRWLSRLYTHPTSCGRVRDKWPDRTLRVGCDCHFRLPQGAYPTPLLHVLGAAEIPVMKERMLVASSKISMQQQVLAQMNEGRKELGATASALVTQLANLKRQRRIIDGHIAKLEQKLAKLVDEAGDEPLETPSGTLKKIEQDGVVKFVLEV